MNAVKLASSSVFPRSVVPSPRASGHLCIAHGLLGNAMNWATAAKHLISHPLLSEKVASATSLDMRNHGRSPHTSAHNNALLASDVETFLLESQKNLSSSGKQICIGHSMGGLTMIGMLLRRFNETQLLPVLGEQKEALLKGWNEKDQLDTRASMRLVNKEAGFSETYPIQKLLFKDNGSTASEGNGAVAAAVIVDTTPTVLIDQGTKETLKRLCNVDLSRIHSYEDAQSELIRVGMDNKMMRDFFTTSIVIHKNDIKSGLLSPASWRCNLHALAGQTDCLQPSITEWFLHFQSKSSSDRNQLLPNPCTLPTLFVFGEDSVYNIRENRDRIKLFFPNSEQAVIKGAGHFVHHEKPSEFANVVAPFVSAFL